MRSPLVLRGVASALSGRIAASAQATPLHSESAELQLLDSERIVLGPVAGPSSGSDVTKSLSIALPPRASADINRAGGTTDAPGAPAGAPAAGSGAPATAGAPAPAFIDALRQAQRMASSVAVGFGG